MRIVSLFVGILLCTALMQTAFAAWNFPNWNAENPNWNAENPNWNAENPNWNVENPNWNVENPNWNAGNLTVWNTAAKNETTKNRTRWSSTDGSLPPSDLMDAQGPSSNYLPKFSDLASGSLNDMQFPGI